MNRKLIIFFLIAVGSLLTLSSCDKDPKEPQLKSDFELYYADADAKMVQVTENNRTVTITKTTYVLFPDNGEMEFSGKLVSKADKATQMMVKITRDNLDGYTDQFCGINCVPSNKETTQEVILNEQVAAGGEQTFEAHLIPDVAGKGLERKITYEFFTREKPEEKISIVVEYKHQPSLAVTHGDEIVGDQFKMKYTGGTEVFHVATSANSWAVTNDGESGWVTVVADVDKNEIKLDFEQNPHEQPRETAIAVEADFGNGEKETKNIKIIQRRDNTVFFFPNMDFMKATREDIKKFETARNYTFDELYDVDIAISDNLPASVDNVIYIVGVKYNRVYLNLTDKGVEQVEDYMQEFVDEFGFIYREIENGEGYYFSPDGMVAAQYITDKDANKDFINIEVIGEVAHTLSELPMGLAFEMGCDEERIAEWEKENGGFNPFRLGNWIIYTTYLENWPFLVRSYQSAVQFSEDTPFDLWLIEIRIGSLNEVLYVKDLAKGTLEISDAFNKLAKDAGFEYVGPEAELFGFDNSIKYIYVKDPNLVLRVLYKEYSFRFSHDMKLVFTDEARYSPTAASSHWSTAMKQLPR